MPHTQALGFRMCNCAELPKSVVDISLSWSFRAIEMEGVNLFPQYFSGLESEEFEPELNHEEDYYRCKECGQAWYIYLDSEESPSPWLAIKVAGVSASLSETDIRAEKELLTILAHNGFEPDGCRISGCKNLKLNGKELCNVHLSLP